MHEQNQHHDNSFSDYYRNAIGFSLVLFTIGLLSQPDTAYLSRTSIYEILNLYGSFVSLVAIVYLTAMNSISTPLALSCFAANGAIIFSINSNFFSFREFFMTDKFNPELIDLTLMILLSGLYTCSAYFILLRYSGISEKKAPRLAALLAVPFLVLSIISVLAASFASSKNALMTTAIMREGLIILFPVYLIIVVNSSKALRLGHDDLIAALMDRFNLIRNSPTHLLIISLTVTTCAINAHIALQNIDNSGMNSLFWIVTLLIAHNELHNVIEKQKDAKLNAFAVSPKISEFIRRHFRNESNWASISSMRTATFLIDHTPNLYSNALPYGLKQIRRHIIHESTKRLLLDKHIETDIKSDRITGAINRENSPTPCVDAIIMFTCLYMDGLPLLQRRIKTLASIMPIVDLNFDKVINEQLFDSLLNDTEWLFYLDYNWVDRHLSQVNGQPSYLHELNVENDESKYVISSELRRRGLLGSYIWLSDSARSQLEQESCHLAKVIVPVELNLANQPGKIIFLLKFEDIIPRLQRYYLFDSHRQTLKEFPQTQDSRRFCNLLELQISQDLSLEKILDVLESIRAFSWRGYRAKDSALMLLVQLHKKTMDFITNSQLSESQKSQQASKFSEMFIVAVNEIGYPSQYLHRAHLEKLSHRDIASLVSIARQPSHEYFFDVWLYLVSNQLNDTEKNLLDLIQFLAEAPNDKWGDNLTFIRTKCVGALNNLPRRFIIKHITKVRSCLNNYYKWILADLRMDELFWLMDVHIHLMTLVNGYIHLELDIMQKLSQMEKFTPQQGSLEELLKLAFTSRLKQITHYENGKKSNSPVAYFSNSA